MSSELFDDEGQDDRQLQDERREVLSPLRLLDLADGMGGYSIGVRCRPVLGYTAIVVDENGMRFQTGPHRTAELAFRAAHEFARTMVTKGDCK